jgi:hypothetical protein
VYISFNAAVDLILILPKIYYVSDMFFFCTQGSKKGA